MDHQPLTRRMALAVLLPFAIAACSGNNGSEIRLGDSDGDTLPELAGLTGDADNHDRLFFTSAIDGNQGLFAVHPERPLDPPEVIDDALDLGDSTVFFFPIHQAHTDPLLGRMTDFRIDRLFYLDTRESGGRGANVVTTNPGLDFVEPAPITSAEPLVIVSPQVFFSYSLEDADDTLMAFQSTDAWRQIRLGGDATTVPLTFDENHTVVASAWDPVTLRGDGWLVINAMTQTLELVDTALATVGSVMFDEAPLDGVVAAHSVGPVFGNGSQYLVIAFADGDGAAELWRYTRGTVGSTGTATPVPGPGGERFLFSADRLLPNGGHIASDGEALFFAVQDATAEEAQLYRVDDEGWSLLASADVLGDFVIVAEERIVWSGIDQVVSLSRDSGTAIVLEEGNDNTGARVTTPVFGSRDGWIFYNLEAGTSEERAVAARIDGSERIALRNARWIGASTLGEAPTTSHLDGLELGEVFLVRNNSELAAVSAAHPGEGLVVLGTLPSAARDARLFGLAPGPHRLLQTVIDGIPASHEVIYVNTREAGSLNTVSSQPDADPQNRPVDRF